MVLHQLATKFAQSYHGPQGQHCFVNIGALQQGSNFQRATTNSSQIPLYLQLKRLIESVPRNLQGYE